MVKLATLTPGTRFRYPDLGKSAVLLSVGASGARIIFDGAKRRVEFTPVTTNDKVEFEAPGTPVLVSSYSDVEVEA